MAFKIDRSQVVQIMICKTKKARVGCKYTRTFQVMQTEFLFKIAFLEECLLE